VRANDIRRSFLGFFEQRGHKVFPSASLVPDDPTLLLTVAGMVPFKPYFKGEKQMDPPRAVSIQKCARTNDIEIVGLTARHQTLFEMLGNFSFGDYFKREAIEWAWELSLDGYGMKPDRIWVTVFESDDEAARIWHDVVGIPEERIIRRGAEDNFWWMGVPGPGGPCSELFYDRGETPMTTFDDGDQLMEYWNLVFTQFDVDGDGRPIADLPRTNVDTGSGLERVAQLLQGVPTAYETDLFAPIIARVQDVTGRRYGADARADVSLRILAEHARSAMFLVGDGVLPSNEGRGYVLRRLIRRAVRHAKILGVDEPVMRELVDASIGVMGDWYTEVASGRAFIEQVVTAEEAGFRETIDRGITLLGTEMSQAKTRKLSGATAFKLHDTYGFPLELTLEIAGEAGLEVDREGFEELMTEQRERARTSRKLDLSDADALAEILSAAGASVFTGYERTEDEAKLVGIVRAGERVREAREDDEVEVVLDATPFYPEGGGQIADSGVIEADGAVLKVLDVQRRLGDLIVHRVRVASGEIGEGVPVRARVDAERRVATERSHTATHILHATLRAALGEHARQAGSLVEPGRLRFDFPHFDRVPREVLDQIEDTVNLRLLGDDLVRPYETTMEEARNRGAMMLFEEKYGDIVRVVEIGDYSVELCGGIHVTHTSQIGAVKILGEGSIGSNLRRVEALTGVEAISDFRRSRALLEHIASLLKSSPDDAPAKIEKLLADLKAAEGKLRAQHAERSLKDVDALAAKAARAGSNWVLVERVDDVAVNDLQKLAGAVRDRLEKQGKPGAVALGSAFSGRAALVVVTSANASVKPQQLLEGAAEKIGARPGGKGQLATAVGPDAGGLDAALDIVRARAKELLG
jgi:alanyl-tRNA synthetase